MKKHTKKILHTHGPRSKLFPNPATFTVTVRKEQSALAVIDDRWELWEAIAVKRNDKEETRGTSSSKNDEYTLRDEDDFREIYPSTKDATNPHRLRGTHLTWYSMYAKYCADYRGYGNGNA